jgi:hypothetical protein
MAARARRSLRRPAALTLAEAQWLLDAYAASDQLAQDASAFMLMCGKRSAPLAPGWWREGEGLQSLLMNHRNADEVRERAARWRRYEAEKAAGMWGGGSSNARQSNSHVPEVSDTTHPISDRGGGNRTGRPHR